MKKTYRDLFIDFDDTLYDTRGNAELALAELYDWANLAQWFPTLEAFTTPYWEANLALWTAYAAGQITRDYLILERFRRPLSVAMPNVTDARCLEISDKFLDLCSCKPGLVDGAKELMEHLHAKGYRLHLCSNGFHEVQYKKLRACALDTYFHSVILSEDAGANKPHLAFFRYALSHTSARAEDTLMIGDNYHTDILGAMNAGIDTLLFRRWGELDTPKSPTFAVDKLTDILHIL